MGEVPNGRGANIEPDDVPEWIALERMAKKDREQQWWGLCNECGYLVDTPNHVYGCEVGRRG